MEAYGREEHWEQQRADAAEAEVKRLREAFDWMCQSMWDLTFDEAEWQEEMTSRGLLVEAPASDEFRREFEWDTMLVPSWRAHEVAERQG